MSKLLAIAMIFIGEGLVIYSEVTGARNIHSLQQILPGVIAMTIIGGLILVGGYILGQKVFQNIWIVGVISVTAIIILEPVITYTIFQELPTRGALIGLILGFAGLLAALLIK